MKLLNLESNPRNPRKIDDWHLEALKKSLHEFGDLGCIVFNKRTGNLIGGHQRVKVMPKDLDIILTEEDGGYVEDAGQRFRVRIVDWDEEKEQMAMLAANQHGGVWDVPMLLTHIEELDAKNVDMDLTGFSIEELARLMAPEPEPDHSGEAPGDRKPVFHQCPECGHVFS